MRFQAILNTIFLKVSGEHAHGPPPEGLQNIFSSLRGFQIFFRPPQKNKKF